MRTMWMVVWLAGCTNAVTFGIEAADTVCEKAQSCDAAAFDATWDSLDTCRDTMKEAFGGPCYLENCETFDPGDADPCLDSIEAATCEDLPADARWSNCSGVWEGCDAPALAGCLADELDE